jgi:hypothetical protein
MTLFKTHGSFLILAHRLFSNNVLSLKISLACQNLAINIPPKQINNNNIVKSILGGQRERS